MTTTAATMDDPTADPEALARAADPIGATRPRPRRTPWRAWSNGAVTRDGATLCPVLPGARALGLEFPRGERDSGEAYADASFAWATRRDALVIRDAIAARLGCGWAARWALLERGGDPDPDDLLPWPTRRLASPPGEVEAVRRLRSFVDDPQAQPGLAEVVRRLLVAREFGLQISSPDQLTLRIYAEACGGTYGEPDAGAAIEYLLGQVDQDGAFLGKVSIAHESAGPEDRHGVRVDLEAVTRSCDEAIAGRPRDGSIPRVTIGADILHAIASFAQLAASTATRALSSAPSHGSPSRGRWNELACLMMRGPVVGGAAASDAWGEVVHPFVGHPIDIITEPAARSTEPPRGGHQARHRTGRPADPRLTTAKTRGVQVDDPVDDVLDPEHRATLASMADPQAGHADAELSSAIRTGLATLGGEGSPSEVQRSVLDRYVARAPTVIETLDESLVLSETWHGVRAVAALIRSVDVVTGHALPQWTPARARAVDAWYAYVRADPSIGHETSKALGSIFRATLAARIGAELADGNRDTLEKLLQGLATQQSRQFWAVNLRSLLAAIPRRTTTEREARAYGFSRFVPVTPDLMSFRSEDCASCGRPLGNHYSLSKENRCHPIDHEIPERALQEARTIGKISETSRVVLWRISAIDRATGDGHLAREVDTALASIDTSGHVANPPLEAVRGWMTDRGRYREGDDAVVIALQTLLDAVALQSGGLP